MYIRHNKNIIFNHISHSMTRVLYKILIIFPFKQILSSKNRLHFFNQLIFQKNKNRKKIFLKTKKMEK